MRLCLLSGAALLLLIGCREPQGTVKDDSAAQSQVMISETLAPTPDVEDLTKDGCPPELLALAQTTANGHVIRVRDHHRPWSSANLFMFWTDKGKYLHFMSRDNGYVQIGPASSMTVLSGLFQEYRFTRDDFNDPENVHWFLREIVGFYGDTPGATVGSSVLLRISEADGGISLWLEGTEKSEKVLLELCLDPKFEFEGSRWKVTFHVFRPGGSVERWEMAGEHDSERACNRIFTIDTALIKPKGTFWHEVMGSQ